jgi:CDP-2,3-bis-(O-geranylgeranyl)-sn-glycerol synthase
VRSELAQGAWLVSPLFVGFVLHGVSIRHGLLRTLARPIDRGALIRQRRLFGDNKTYRGVVCVALGTMLGFVALTAMRDPTEQSALAALPSGSFAALLGLGVGGAAMLAELPNSALKRQLDIQPGTQGSGLSALLFHVLDQIDVLAGAWLVLAIFVSATPRLVLGSALFMYLGHQLITLLGYLLGMRATAR